MLQRRLIGPARKSIVLQMTPKISSFVFSITILLIGLERGACMKSRSTSFSKVSTGTLCCGRRRNLFRSCRTKRIPVILTVCLCILMSFNSWHLCPAEDPFETALDFYVLAFISHCICLVEILKILEQRGSLLWLNFSMFFHMFFWHLLSKAEYTMIYEITLNAKVYSDFFKWHRPILISFLK